MHQISKKSVNNCSRYCVPKFCSGRIDGRTDGQAKNGSCS